MKEEQQQQRYSSPMLLLLYLCSLLSVTKSVISPSVLSSTITSSSTTRNCFTLYSDFIPGSLEGEWSGLNDEEWEIEEKEGRRQRVSHRSIYPLLWYYYIYLSVLHYYTSCRQTHIFDIYINMTYFSIYIKNINCLIVNTLCSYF